MDELFRRLRALESPTGAKDPNEKIQDIIFDRLRCLEKRADKLEALHYKMIGAYAAITVMAGVAFKLWS